MQRRAAFTLLAGILAGLLPLMPGAGLLFMLWGAFLPLLLLGFSEGPRACVQACAISILIVLNMAGNSEGLTVAMFVAMPVSLLTNRLLLFRRDAQGRVQWYPAIRVFAELCLLGAAVAFAFALAVGNSNDASLGEMLRNTVKGDLSGYDTNAASITQSLVNDWGFFFIAAIVWMWVFTIWMLAIIANRLLALRAQGLRPAIVFLPGESLPGWLPLLLALFMLLGLLGSGNDAFVGKCLSLIMLLPYLVSGMARIHHISQHWHRRYLWLMMIYIILIFQSWSTIFVAGAGLYFHLAEMLDKRRKIG